MHLTRESKYALLGLAYLAASPPGQLTSLTEIADAQNLPANFLSKIFQKLARYDLVVSERGRGRGYALARSPARVCMRDILEAVEGPSVFDRCLLWNGHCSDTNPCPLHYRLKELRPAVESTVGKVTLAEYLARSRRAGGWRVAPPAKRKATRSQV